MNNQSLKIVFICSSLEPGKDGVGDYTRRLAAALVKAGHACTILSINDRYITCEIEEIQQSDGEDVPVLRLSASIEIKDRYARARDWITTFDPQWISLQFVPFGYHPKGLKVGLGNLLSSLSDKASWHIMFHELWVGIAKEESVKLKLWGRGQRVLIRSLVNKLAPKIVHTQTPLYRLLLAKIGVEAALLPLFGNIPVIAARQDKLSSGISLVVFGAIHDKAPIEDFAREAAVYAKQQGKPVSLIMLGRSNSEQERWAAAFKNEGLQVDVMGEQSARKISDVFSQSTFGLSATALAVIEKSGSYAAMREHGLSVISVAKPWTPAGIDQPAMPDGVIAYRPGNFEQCIANPTYTAHHNGVVEVADKFAKALLSVKII